MSTFSQALVAIVPAAGVGKRMLANCPKQYLRLHQYTILEHTVLRLLSQQNIEQVVIALGADDEYFTETTLATHPNVKTVIGGKERVDSVLAALLTINSDKYPWVLVHDAARPCVQISDINKLIDVCLSQDVGGLLAAPVRDTMKRADAQGKVIATENRENLWHALTPQMYKTEQLTQAIEVGLAQGTVITDESSAIEAFGLPSQLVAASFDNIKITHPDDLALAEFILQKQKDN